MLNVQLEVLYSYVFPKFPQVVADPFMRHPPELFFSRSPYNRVDYARLFVSSHYCHRTEKRNRQCHGDQVARSNTCLVS